MPVEAGTKSRGPRSSREGPCGQLQGSSRERLGSIGVAAPQASQQPGPGECQ